MKEKLTPLIRHITIKQLRGFTAICELGSISGAAKALHLTPPAISLQLRGLEEIIEIPLLERNPTGLKPTRAGDALLACSRDIESSMIEFSEILDEISGINRGVVSIGVVSTARYFAPNVLASFNQVYPDVKLRLQVGNRESIIKKLEDLEIDFAVTGLPPKHFKVESEYIGKNPQLIIGPPNHEFAESAAISLSALKNQTFLLREIGSGTRAVAEKLFQKAGIEHDESGVEFGSNETIKQAVMAGMGIAVISAHTVAAELAEKRLVSLNVKGLPVNRKWFVVKNANKRFLPSALALWNHFARSGKDFLPVR
jgi:LysR family transcriptional regulator, low CO2-responsive transcriptional regulator